MLGGLGDDNKRLRIHKVSWVMIAVGIKLIEEGDTS